MAQVRPLLSFEKSRGAKEGIHVSQSQVTVPGSGDGASSGSHKHNFKSHKDKDKVFNLDAVYTSSTTQGMIFQTSIEPLLQSFLSGFNTTVLAYGQTGSGKSFTMGTTSESVEQARAALSASIDAAGPSANELQDLGMVPHTLYKLFNLLEDKDYVLQVSFLEVHNEVVRSLVGESTGEELRVGQDAQGQVALAGPGSRPVPITSCDQALSLFAEGLQRRAVGSTLMNDRSSRSHALFTLHLTQVQQATSSCASPSAASSPEAVDQDEEKAVSRASSSTDLLKLQSKFHFVDLAGSESAGRTGAEGARQREGGNINQGLLALGKVITALAAKRGGEHAQGSSSSSQSSTTHIPYRDSKLTRLLQGSLGGNAKTLMIACISPADQNSAETISTLQYAQRTRQIKNRAEQNAVAAGAKGKLSREEAEVLLQKLGKAQARVLKLEQELEQCTCQERENKTDDVGESESATDLSADDSFSASSSSSSWTSSISSSPVSVRSGAVTSRNTPNTSPSNKKRRSSFTCPHCGGGGPNGSMVRRHSSASRGSSSSILSAGTTRRLEDLQKQLARAKAELQERDQQLKQAQDKATDYRQRLTAALRRQKHINSMATGGHGRLMPETTGAASSRLSRDTEQKLAKLAEREQHWEERLLQVHDRLGAALSNHQASCEGPGGGAAPSSAGMPAAVADASIPVSGLSGANHSDTSGGGSIMSSPFHSQHPSGDNSVGRLLFIASTEPRSLGTTGRRICRFIKTLKIAYGWHSSGDAAGIPPDCLRVLAAQNIEVLKRHIPTANVLFWWASRLKDQAQRKLHLQAIDHSDPEDLAAESDDVDGDEGTFRQALYCFLETSRASRPFVCSVLEEIIQAQRHMEREVPLFDIAEEQAADSAATPELEANTRKEKCAAAAAAAAAASAAAATGSLLPASDPRSAHMPYWWLCRPANFPTLDLSYLHRLLAESDHSRDENGVVAVAIPAAATASCKNVWKDDPTDSAPKEAVSVPLKRRRKSAEEQAGERPSRRSVSEEVPTRRGDPSCKRLCKPGNGGVFSDSVLKDQSLAQSNASNNSNTSQQSYSSLPLKNVRSSTEIVSSPRSKFASEHEGENILPMPIIQEEVS